MKCLWHYEWVKLPRNIVPEGKGVLGDWVRLASRAAFRKGTSLYCGYTNTVIPGMWAGGVVGLKSILGTKSRKKALDTMEKLQKMGYVRYELDADTKKFTYQITDWVRKCSGAACMKGAVYTTEGYGFLCIPRNITERLVREHYIFDEADAWLDLWCHTVTEDPNNVFSFMAPAVQYGKYGAILTLETLGQRWGWEKTKVWRFFQKHGDVFALYRLASSYGCLIFNKRYPVDAGVSLPEQEEIMETVGEIRGLSADVPKKGSEHEHLSRMVAWYSRKLTCRLVETGNESGNEGKAESGEKSRVAHSGTIIYTYLSLCRNCKNCNYDCQKVNITTLAVQDRKQIRGPCGAVDLTEIAKESLFYE